MRSAKGAAGDIIGKLQITCGKFENNTISDVRNKLTNCKQWLDNK